jgi:hypothetical protein
MLNYQLFQKYQKKLKCLKYHLNLRCLNYQLNLQYQR